jgi:hypothetical protein
MRLNVLLLLLIPVALSAQTYSISGMVTDDTDQVLPGATARLLHPWGEEVGGQVASPSGRFSFRDISRGGYVLEISFLGFETRRQELELRDRDLDLGRIRLSDRAVLLEGVEVKEKAPIAAQNEDTIQFNATAFKVMKDASAEDLIGKIPSVQVEGGQLRAQGETVGRVLVDGKPFFGNDPTAALRNLPAEVIDKIQIFDQASEQSQFSGIQDGNTVKTINIVTRPDMRAGQFGKIYSGYGTDQRYQVGGNINIFDGQRRISLIGMSNNINVQNFAAEDILGVLGQSGRGGPPAMPGRPSFRGNSTANDFLVSPRGGISNTTAFGLNYSDKWGEKIEVTASYFYNLSDNRAENEMLRQFGATEGIGQRIDSRSLATSNNQNHRFSMRMEYTIDSMNSILFRPRFTLQRNRGNEISRSETLLGLDPLNTGATDFHSRLFGLSGDGDLLWRHRFSKQRRTMSVNLVSGMSPRNGDNQLHSENAFFAPVLRLDTLDQRADLDSRNYNASVNIEYTEPVSASSQMLFNYRLSYQQEESDRLTFAFDPLEGDYTNRIDPLSNIFSNDFLTHNGGLGYSFNKGRDLNVTVRVNYQVASLINNQSLPLEQQFRSDFRNVLPFGSVRWSLDRQRNFRLFWRSSTRLPAIEQLQNVVNNQNPLQLRTGNPNLRQSASNNLFLRYQHTDPARSRMFFIMGGGGLTDDQIVNSTWLAGADNPFLAQFNLPPGAQLVVPVNLSGAWNARSFVSYSLPFSLIRSNLNLDMGYTFQNNPGLINGARTEARNHVVSAGVTISSNISDKLDFTLSGRPAWNVVSNTLQPAADNAFISQLSTLRFNWQLWRGIVLRTDVSHQYFGGLAEGFNQNYLLWNAALGTKLFRNERGELALSMNDILSQNRNISRNVTETWIEDSWTNALTRFVMLSFTYNLRHFGKPSEKTRSGEPGMMFH